MKTIQNIVKFNLLVVFLIGVSLLSARAQSSNKTIVLTDKELTQVVPTGFYFEGQSAPTQTRNAAAARVGDKRFIVVGLVDTSGYSTEISGKYEGFFITDSTIILGGEKLPTGAYGFGFSADGKLNIFDIGGKKILSVATKNDAAMRRPRPLNLLLDAGELRFYKGRTFAVIKAK
ncbi:MAG: hypothetical protein M3033_11860 [Acidobacteriota bacterium]|nr:hypothetical protein [Acidobacteriota bacterium]